MVLILLINYRLLIKRYMIPYPIEITDETVITICFFDSEWPYMIVSEERMMRLVRDGYFMEYPCWVYVSDGKLIAARQIMYE